jgi:hypothetical protein
LDSVKDISDEIICVYNDTTDSSVQIAKDSGAFVFEYINEEEHSWSEVNVRRKLLELGRDHGGTHFICLDADEALSSNFKDNLHVLEKLDKGEVIIMQWIALWKRLDRYKSDSSVWSNNYKDFIFKDDGKTDFPEVKIHTPRTPTIGWERIKIEKNIGNILHFQFSNWESFQLKQAYYRCRDLIENDGRNIKEINEKYAITKDTNKYKSKFVKKTYELKTTKRINENWVQGINLPSLDKIYDQGVWRLKVIEEWFDAFGAEYFKDLDIWHVKEIAALRNN